VAAIAGGHASNVDRSTVHRQLTSEGAISGTARLIRSAGSEPVVPAPIPAPRTPSFTPSATPNPADSPPAIGSTPARRETATIRRSTLNAGAGSPQSGREDRFSSTGSSDGAPSDTLRRVLRSQTAIQRRATRSPATSTSSVVSRYASIERPAASVSPQAERLEMTEQLLEALEERILRALERRGGIQRGWF
jgi:hypothetical protein